MTMPKARALSLVASATILLLALLLQSTFAIGRDAAFYIYVDLQVLDGHFPNYAPVDGVLSTFLVSNFLLFAPVAALLKVAPFIGAKAALTIFVLALAGVAFGRLWHLCRSLEQSGVTVWLMPPIFIALALGFPVDSFAQREHLLPLLLLPWVCHVVAELEGTTPRRPDMLAAILAVTGLLIKPWFVLAWLGVEAVRLVRFRNWRVLIGPFEIAVVVCHVAYYGGVALLVVKAPYPPDFMAWVFGLKRAYLHKGLAEMLIRKYSLLWLMAGLSLAVGLTGRQRATTLMLALLVIAGMASAILQANGNDYHWLSATIWAALLCGWTVFTASAGRARMLAATSLASFLVLAGLRTEMIRPWENGVTYKVRIVSAALMERPAVDGRTLVYLFDDYGPLYPALLMSGYRLVSSFQTYWFLAAIEAEALHAGRPPKPEWLDGLVETTVQDITVGRPAVVIMPEGNPPTGLPLIIDDPRVKAALSDYRREREAGNFSILVRK